VFFPYTCELTKSEKKRIDAAPRCRFFVYGCSDAPVATGASGVGELRDYPVRSFQFALDRSTHVNSGILPDQQPRDTPQALVRVLLDMDAQAGTDDHRCAVTMVVDRPFAGDDLVLYRS
jgi:hypothetical protein